MYSSTIPYKPPSEYAINPLANNYNPYASLYSESQRRARLSSTCESSAGSSAASSAGSAQYSGADSGSGSAAPSERDSDGSEGRYEESEGSASVEREPLEGEITNQEKEAVEKFFSGLKTQVRQIRLRYKTYGAVGRILSDRY